MIKCALSIGNKYLLFFILWFQKGRFCSIRSNIFLFYIEKLHKFHVIHLPFTDITKETTYISLSKLPSRACIAYHIILNREFLHTKKLLKPKF